MLVNFRVSPEVLARHCPAPFRPQTVNGYAMAGICLIRLKNIRPKWMPSFIGLSSENAAHRFAVEWDSEAGIKTGVFIPRRDTSSRINSIAGGRLFPGFHHRAIFNIEESGDEYRLAMTSVDRSTKLVVEASIAEQLPSASIFSSASECSSFFENGSLGYSPTHVDGAYDGLELCSKNWQVHPLSVSNVRSSFFDDPESFPAGSIEFDNALLMRDIHHEWRGREPICCGIAEKA